MVGTRREDIVAATQLLLDDPGEYQRMTSGGNPYGDGKAAERIVQVIRNKLGSVG